MSQTSLILDFLSFWILFNPELAKLWIMSTLHVLFSSSFSLPLTIDLSPCDRLLVLPLILLSNTVNAAIPKALTKIKTAILLPDVQNFYKEYEYKMYKRKHCKTHGFFCELFVWTNFCMKVGN